MGDSFKKALDIAKEAHKNQKDKSGLPYILHPLAVSDKVKSEKERIVAVLHDVVEDTNITLEDLAKDFSKEIVDAIDAISKRDSETYFNYIERVKTNSLATKVKLADLDHNMSPERKFVGMGSLIGRYQKAKEVLLEK